MTWSIYVGTAIMLLTVGGMLWMRNRPVRDAHGNAVDEIGRPIGQLSSEANVVLRALRQSYEPLTGWDLRRHVTMSRRDFYAMIAGLEHRDLITSRIDQLGGHNVRRYQLTDYGLTIFDGDDGARAA